MAVGGLAVTALVAAMSLTACSAENGVDGKDGVAGIDGKDGANGTDGKDGIDGKDGVSCSAKALEDASGYTLTCGDKEIGKILNGNDGIEGKAGASCSAAPNADTTGYVISCDGKEVGLIKNGINGEDGGDGKDGASCSATPLDDETGFTLTCGEDEIGVIKNGTAGTSCSAAPNADGTGYTITCGDEAPFTILNGAKGDKGEKGENAKTIYTMAMMNGGGTLREYVVYASGNLTPGSVADADKGVGSFKTWIGADVSAKGVYNMTTGLDDGKGESGWWFTFDDRLNDNGSSMVVLPAQVGENKSMDAVVDACQGFCGSVNLDEGAGSPFAGVGFSTVNGKKYESSYNKGGDVSNWNGLCLAYSAGGTQGLSLNVKVQHPFEKTVTEYNSYRVNLPVNNSAIVNIPWSAFAQDAGWCKTPAGGFAEILDQAAAVLLEFDGEAGEAGYFNIQKIGMYGHCGEVVEEPVVNPYEGIPQYEFVAGTNIIKPFTASSDDKSSEFKTWRGVDGQSKFPNGEGWMFFYTDKNEDDPEIAAANKSDFIFPVSYEADHNFVKSHVEACDGICGTLYLKTSTTGATQNRYASLYTDIKADTDKGSDLSGIKGLCLTYTLKGDVDYVYLRIDPIDEKNTTGYNYHRKALPQAETPITLNVPWSEFKQAKDGEGNLFFGKEKSIDYVVKQSQSIQVFFDGEAGQTADFNIMQLGAYGNCQ